MIALFDLDELNNLYQKHHPLCLHVDLSLIVKILTKDFDSGCIQQKELVWEVIETSEHFDDEFFMSKVNDDYLLQLDSMIDEFYFTLFNFLNNKINNEKISLNVIDVGVFNKNLIIEVLNDD